MNEEKMRLVDCDSLKCNHTFEILESNIKSMIMNDRCVLYENIQCPKCGRKSKVVRDHELREACAIRDTIKANAPVSCPICQSTQIYASDKGYSLAKGAVGSVLLGGVGLLAGIHGSKQVILTCMVCGKKFKPGQ